MPDGLYRSPALDHPALNGDVSFAMLPPASRRIFRGRAEAVAAADLALGFALPRQACRANASGDRAALWLGPDEWLLLGPEDDEFPELATLEPPHALVDVSHRQVAFGLSGPHAADALNAGCPLDLERAAFPVGMCTRTVLAKAEIVLWRTATDAFHIEVARSFAAYVWEFLAEASLEFRP